MLKAVLGLCNGLEEALEVGHGSEEAVAVEAGVVLEVELAVTEAEGRAVMLGEPVAGRVGSGLLDGVDGAEPVGVVVGPAVELVDTLAAAVFVAVVVGKADELGDWVENGVLPAVAVGLWEAVAAEVGSALAEFVGKAVMLRLLLGAELADAVVVPVGVALGKMLALPLAVGAADMVPETLGVTLRLLVELAVLELLGKRVDDDVGVEAAVPVLL